MKDGAEMITVVFFVAFGLAGLYMILSSAFIEKIESLDDDITDERWSSKNTKLLMKYVFYFKESGNFPGQVRTLLMCVRATFVLGLSSYILLLALIFFQ